MRWARSLSASIKARSRRELTRLDVATVVVRIDVKCGEPAGVVVVIVLAGVRVVLDGAPRLKRRDGEAHLRTLWGVYISRLPQTSLPQVLTFWQISLYFTDKDAPPQDAPGDGAVRGLASCR